jgi:cytochrome c peroxidase
MTNSQNHSGLRTLLRHRRVPMVLAASTVALAVTLAGNAATAPVRPPMPPGGPGSGRPGPQPPNQGQPTQPTQPSPPSNGQTFADATGQSTSISTTGPAGATHPFFTPLGTNGRACVTCHRPDTGWTVTPEQIQARFAQSNGLDPIFRPVDGAVSPLADVSTVMARQAAYRMLMTKGDIRVGLPIPNGAEFTLTAVDDPYKFATATQLSLFRRPLPATDLKFLSTVMWDGRETASNATIQGDLAHQAVDAVLQHMQANVVPSQTTINQIVAFESGLFSAQSFDNGAGALDAAPAKGGPVALSTQTYFPGINDPATRNFDPHVFNIYAGWAGTVSNPTQAVARRQSIARGEAIFNNRQFSVENVGGLNDVLKRPVITMTCSTCHNAPNAGSHSVPLYLDLGLASAQRRTPDLPLYTLRNRSTGQTRQVTDPGRALVTGKWADIGEFKIPTLRDLPARAPYFHNGSAPDVDAVIAFYDRRFNIGLSPQERQDLKAFLESL